MKQKRVRIVEEDYEVVGIDRSHKYLREKKAYNEHLHDKKKRTLLRRRQRAEKRQYCW